jgi:hypothetical protein
VNRGRGRRCVPGRARNVRARLSAAQRSGRPPRGSSLGSARREGRGVLAGSARRSQRTRRATQTSTSFPKRRRNSSDDERHSSEHVPTQGTSASRAYAQQALQALQVTRDALNDEDPAGIDVALRTADVYAPLAQAAAAAEIAVALRPHRHPGTFAAPLRRCYLNLDRWISQIPTHALPRTARPAGKAPRSPGYPEVKRLLSPLASTGLAASLSLVVAFARDAFRSPGGYDRLRDRDMRGRQPPLTR